MATQLFTDKLTIVHCCHTGCGIAFGVTADLEERRRSDHKNFYCPNGHHQYWPQESGEEKLRKQLALAERQLDNVRSREAEQMARAEAAERSARALKGHLTRWKRRVSNGVCPVAGCKRHFPNVQKHVKTCHAEWLAEHPEVFETTPA